MRASSPPQVKSCKKRQTSRNSHMAKMRSWKVHQSQLQESTWRSVNLSFCRLQSHLLGHDESLQSTLVPLPLKLAMSIDNALQRLLLRLCPLRSTSTRLPSSTLLSTFPSAKSTTSLTPPAHSYAAALVRIGTSLALCSTSSICSAKMMLWQSSRASAASAPEKLQPRYAGSA